MEQDQLFELLLKKHRIIIERYIHYRLPNSHDADDVIQETYYAAIVGFDKLQNKELFKPWILSIAKNQCNLWYRKNYGHSTVSLESISNIAIHTFYDIDDLRVYCKRFPKSRPSY